MFLNDIYSSFESVFHAFHLYGKLNRESFMEPTFHCFFLYNMNNLILRLVGLPEVRRGDIFLVALKVLIPIQMG